MSFFKPISDLMQEDYSLQFILEMKNGKMTVTFIPKFKSDNKDITSKLVPLSITEDPVELDRTLVLTISSAMNNTRDFAQALKAYEDGLKSAKKEFDKKGKKEEVKEEKKAEPQTEIKQEEKPSPELIDVNTGEVKTPPVEKPKAETKPKPAADKPKEIRAVSLDDLAGEDMDENAPEQEEQEQEQPRKDVKPVDDDESW